jgi:hypothetical protein
MTVAPVQGPSVVRHAGTSPVATLGAETGGGGAAQTDTAVEVCGAPVAATRVDPDTLGAREHPPSTNTSNTRRNTSAV